MDITEALTICFTTKSVCIFRKVCVFQYSNAVVQGQSETNKHNRKILSCENSCFDSLDLFMEDQVAFLISLIILQYSGIACY